MSTPPPYLAGPRHPDAAAPAYGPVPSPAPSPSRPRRGRGRKVLWGIGGVLIASAVWAGAVLTVPGLVGGRDAAGSAPGTAGFRVVDDLCAAARITSFSRIYPAQSGTPYHYTTRHRALDDMYCSQYRKRAGGDSEYVSLYLQTQLHKAVDPRPEFEAQRDGLRQRGYQITAVPGLGDDAYLGYLDDLSRSDPTWHYLTQVLYVRQRGLTFYASWSGSYQDGRTAAPDREEVRLALLADARELLRSIGARV